MFYKQNFLPLLCEFKKVKDIHFLDVSEKETISLVGAWLFYMNQNFFKFKGKLSLNKSVRGIWPPFSNFTLTFVSKSD